MSRTIEAFQEQIDDLREEVSQLMFTVDLLSKALYSMPQDTDDTAAQYEIMLMMSEIKKEYPDVVWSVARREMPNVGYDVLVSNAAFYWDFDEAVAMIRGRLDLLAQEGIHIGLVEEV